MYTEEPWALVHLRSTLCWVLVEDVVRVRSSGYAGPGTVTCRVTVALSPSLSLAVSRTV
jgi:hypothetical protein